MKLRNARSLIFDSSLNRNWIGVQLIATPITSKINIVIKHTQDFNFLINKLKRNLYYQKLLLLTNSNLEVKPPMDNINETGMIEV